MPAQYVVDFSFKTYFKRFPARIENTASWSAFASTNLRRGYEHLLLPMKANAVWLYELLINMINMSNL